MLTRLIAVAAIGLVAAVTAPGRAGALSSQQVTEGFVRAVVDYCLKSVSSGVSIASLPESDRKGVTPSKPGTNMLFGDEAKAPAWDVAPAAGIVVAFEPAPRTCKVVGYGPPVRQTFNDALARARKIAPDFADLKLEPGYKPIVAGLTRGTGSEAIRIELSGAEPGTPGHAFRFPMLNATVTRGAPAPATQSR